uniref:Nitric oxide synthase-interacting protein zinc-finger domain-containing protein n=1 Tax=Chlamydomonas euryale TaxID=1486919 RepID=A0A7R9YV45_9CHLO|mmetsp:Transcript_29468/g.87173  ORF Transcript_29468/g.87173 Transcript_29468/m.87173 type:complete len:321 (+) Transcript_29468:118-1080(+)
MGKGQRHSKNAGVMGAEGLRYHERRALGFGTVKERLGKDSLGNFYDCCLTLQPVKDPVITPAGFLYSKEAILENLLQQKKAIKRKLAAYEAAQEAAARKVAEQEAIAQHAEVIAFDRANHMGIQDKTVDSIKAAISSEAAAAQAQQGATSVMNIKENEERLKSLKAFWMPSKAPEAEIHLEKPSTDTLCPASGNKLRMKDLIPIRFTPVPQGADGLYMDPITKDALTNHSKLVVIKTTGDVVLKETYSKLIKPDGVMNGKKVRESDVVELQTGGTGFSARDGERAQSSKYAQLGVGSGRQQLRGQQGLGASSLGGLKLMN